MKDPKPALQTKMYGILSGNLSLSGSPVVVYDKANIPSDREYPHGIISDWTIADWSDKDKFGGDVTVTLMYYDRQEGSQGSRADLYSLCNQTLGLLRVRPSNGRNAFDGMQDFNVVTVTLDASNSLPKEQNDTHVTMGEMIRFRLRVEEK